MSNKLAVNMLDTITSSRAASFKNCRRRHFYEFEIGMRPTIDGKALRLGSAYHAGVDAWHKTADVNAAVEAVRATYGPCPEALDPIEWEFECETMTALLSGYAWKWGSSRKVLASEISFRVPLVNPETGAKSTLWELAGKIDAVVQLEDGRIAVCEEKTVSEEVGLDGQYWRRLAIAPQTSIYVYAARAMGYDVASVLYSLTRKPTIKPTAVSILDGDGLKVVLDANGQRVRNAAKKAKKTCAVCGGTGQDKRTPEARSQLNAEIPDCPCTFGDFRQTADTAKGYVIQTRPMTCEEWTERLTADIGERPQYYYAQNEVACLDSDITETMQELWDIQKTLREAQLTNRWFKTVGPWTCDFCPYLGLCVSRWTPDAGTPEGMQIVENRFPEL